MPEGTYAEERDRLRRVLAELADLADERESADVAEAARVLDKKLVENRFTVVVVGEFKRGKTTFVNALLGSPVLPTAVVPLTSIVTAVTWGETPRSVIRFDDGHEEDVAPEELERYVTERGNPDNRLGVDRALLSYPSEDLRDGVFLVDTPGVGSVYRHNTDVARDYIPEADVAIFLTSADPPISDSERAFLADVRAETVGMFFVLNKVDYLAEPERSEAIAFTERVLADAMDRPVDVYPVSARGAVEAKLAGSAIGLETSGFDAFERDFRAYLLAEKGRAILASAASRAASLCADEMNSIDVEERALALPIDELSAAKARMEDVFAQTRTAREDLRPLLKAETDRLFARVEHDLEDLRERAEERLRSVVHGFVGSREDVRGAGDELRALTQDALRHAVERWRRAEEQSVAEAFRQTTTRFVAEADDAAAETVRLCGQILGIDLSAARVVPELSEDTRFSFSFFEPPTIVESLLPDVRRFLPSKAARRSLERDATRRVPEIVDKHCGRLRYDYRRRLEASRMELERALDSRLEATIAGLRKGIGRSDADRSKGEEELQIARASARAWRDRLAGLRDELASQIAGATP
jgi:signal recognition particle receptor subunit beta